MSIRGMYLAGKRVIRRVARVLARPVRRDRGTGGILIQPYRGYGSAEEMYLMGRVFRQAGIGYRWRAQSARRDLLDVVRRTLRWGVGDAVLVARVSSAAAGNGNSGNANSGNANSGSTSGASGHAEAAETTLRVRTNRDGYFRIHLRPRQRPAPDQRWHRIDLELVEPVEMAGDEGAKVQGKVFVPPATAERVVISDIDDTVMCTGVMNKAKMMWRLFMQGPRSRVAFPGVASLYRALHRGPTGDQFNPMLYVSRGPWSIYEVLEEFFRLHHIPVGPILFLREWGLSLQRPLPQRSEGHKLHLIRDMLKLYHDLPFVLIGDSGQHDPEIYAQVVQEHPGRVAAVYIRNVSRSPERVHAIEELAKQVLDSGSTLMLAADSYFMAKHAAEHGLISPAALKEVRDEKHADPDTPARQQTLEIEQPTDSETRRAVEQGVLEDALNADTGTDTPPSVTVESKEH